MRSLRLLAGLAATAAFGALLTGPSYGAANSSQSPATAAASWSCVSVPFHTRYFTGPIRSEPMSTAAVRARVTDYPLDVNGSCFNHIYDTHWWRVIYVSHNSPGYICSGNEV